jgi:hypothetical protein
MKQIYYKDKFQQIGLCFENDVDRNYSLESFKLGKTEGKATKLLMMSINIREWLIYSFCLSLTNAFPLIKKKTKFSSYIRKFRWDQ